MILLGLISTVYNYVAGSPKPSSSGHANSEVSIASAASVERKSGAPEKGRVGGSTKHHYSSIVVHIYALSKRDIDAVCESIEKTIADYLTDTVIGEEKKDQELISRLTEEQVSLSRYSLMWEFCLIVST